MASKLIISISGMRGIIGENLTPDIGARYGCAFGSFLRSGSEQGHKLRVCIGRDSRPSGQMMLSAVTSGLCAAGIDVIDLGIVTTPCVGIMLRHLGCAGGVVITASHNPTPYNGIKLLLDNGIAPPKDQAQKIVDIYHEQDFQLADSVNCGRVSTNDQTDSVHIDKVLALIEPDKISGQGFRVVLDSVNGAGSRVGVKMLKELGCDVRAMNYEQSGLFAHSPEPTSENLTGLCEEVKRTGAAAGFAQDPDADRLAVVDENGDYIGEEYTLALAAMYVLSKNPSACTAANLSTSRMIDDVARRYGAKVFRTPVGEANVAQAMLEHDCIIGGEGNGGVIDTRVGPVRDSLVAMAMVLELMAETGKSISELKDQIGCYWMKKDKYPAEPEQAKQIIEKAKELFAGARVNESDGCRFDLADGWVHIRTSNTEPVMRVIVECENSENGQRYMEQVRGIQKEVLGK